MKDCRECRSYRDCEGHIYIVDTEAGKQYVAWYHYGEIRWCPHQVIFIIKNSEVLRAGRWPLDPEGSGYIDPKIKTGYRSEAYYIKSMGILAEVEYRLARCGLDRYLVEDRYVNDTCEEEIAQFTGLRVEEVHRRINAVLNYIRGWRRKRYSYSEFVGHRRA